MFSHGQRLFVGRGKPQPLTMSPMLQLVLVLISLDGVYGCASVTKSATHTKTCASAVPDQATCQAMATADAGLRWDGARNWSDRQPGCLEGSGDVNWNTNTNGQATISHQKPLCCTLPVPSTASTTGPTNLALNKPATQSSMTGGWSASRAVDGNTDNLDSDNSCSLVVATDPFWKVDLQSTYNITSVHVTNRLLIGGTPGAAMRLDLFTIKVDDHVCGSNLVVPMGETGDFTCDPPLSGSSVQIELQGEDRQLLLCEVEVYANGGVAVDSAVGCYDGAAYRTQACAPKNCTGPGPTRCTSCNVGDALVPWRDEGKEGTCQTYTDDMQVRNLPGLYEATKDMPSYLAKWGIQRSVLALPGAANLTALNVIFDVECYVRKVVVCQTVGTSVTCQVQKEARLKSIDYVEYEALGVKIGTVSPKSVCDTAAGGSQSSHSKSLSHQTCLGFEIPLSVVTKFANVSSVHEACTPVIQLL